VPLERPTLRSIDFAQAIVASPPNASTSYVQLAGGIQALFHHPRVEATCAATLQVIRIPRVAAYPLLERVSLGRVGSFAIPFSSSTIEMTL
jgi:hypothetical protein